MRCAPVTRPRLDLKKEVIKSPGRQQILATCKTKNRMALEFDPLRAQKSEPPLTRIERASRKGSSTIDQVPNQKSSLLLAGRLLLIESGFLGDLQRQTTRKSHWYSWTLLEISLASAVSLK